MQLNAAQERAVEERGVQLVLAGPGSGKTRVITEKILHLLANGAKAESILALTFSAKAATEMIERLEREIDVSDITVSTFHSFCLDVLRDNILDSGVSFTSGLISTTNQLVWGLRNIDTFGFEHIELGNNERNVIESITEGISAFRDELITPEELKAYLERKDSEKLEESDRAYLNQLKDLLKVYEAYLQYKRKEMLLDFDDMIHEASYLLNRKPLLLKRYHDRYDHVLVDEFQDTNYAQLYLIKQLADDDVCVVGDDDQSIYRFRGAYLTNFKDFKEHFGNHVEILLDHNYRNSGNILTCSLQLMSNTPNREGKMLTTTNPDGDTIIVARCENEHAEAQFVLQEIERLIGTPLVSRADNTEREITYGDIAVLSRRRAEGMKYHSALRKRGIPCEFVGDVDFFTTPIVRNVRAYLNIVKNPLRAGIYLNRIMKITGVTEVNVQRLNSHAERLAWEDETSDFVYECMLNADSLIATQVEQVHEITRTIEQMLIAKERVTLSELVYNVLLRDTDLYKRSLEEENWRNVQLLNKFYEIAQEYESITKHPSLTDFLEYLDLLSGFQIELEEVEETNSVKVMTVHQSKGKEFPIVFIVDAATNRFPLRYQAKPFYVPNDLAKGMKTGDDEKSLYEQEERRLFYVAMTRAEQKLYVTYAERYGQNVRKTKPSKFLAELEFEQNPRIDVIDVPQKSQETLTKVESTLEQTKVALQNQAVQAIYSTQLKTALQRIVELEKLRFYENGGALEDFDSHSFLTIEDSDEHLRMLVEGERAALVSEDHHFSASALQTYSNCPMQYKYGYILRVPTVPRTYFNLGHVVHSVIEHLTKDELDGIPPTKERAMEMLARFWSSAAYTTKQKEREDKALAEQMFKTYVAWQTENENEVVDAEMKFAFTLNGRTVKGFIDRLERTPDGEYVVIDYKTGYPTETKNSIRESIQMNVYCLAILEKFGCVPKKASFFYVKHDKHVHYYPEGEQLEQQKLRLSGMVEAVLSEHFLETPAYQTCRSCSYGDLCEVKEISD
ncbi:MAG: ATP-dependent helicase [Halobacteriota archaeon]